MTLFKPHFANTMGLYLPHAEKKEGANKDVYDRPGKSPPSSSTSLPVRSPRLCSLKKVFALERRREEEGREGAFGKLSQLPPPFLGVDPRETHLLHRAKQNTIGQMTFI